VRSFGLFQTFFSGFALFLGTVRDLSEPHQATGHGLFSLFFSFLFFSFVLFFHSLEDGGVARPGSQSSLVHRDLLQYSSIFISF